MCVVSCLLFVDCCGLIVVRCVLSVACCLLHVVCCLLFIFRCCCKLFCFQRGAHHNSPWLKSRCHEPCRCDQRLPLNRSRCHYLFEGYACCFKNAPLLAIQLPHSLFSTMVVATLWPIGTIEIESRFSHIASAFRGSH